MARPLTEGERAKVERLLTEHPAADAYRAQLDRTVVSGVCACGCGSLDLSVAEDAPRADRPSEVVGRIDQPDGSWLMLHAHEGALVELETLRFTPEGSDPVNSG